MAAASGTNGMPSQGSILAPSTAASTTSAAPNEVKEVRVEKEYVSGVNHRSFKASQGELGIDPCKEGNYCGQPSLASVGPNQAQKKERKRSIKKMRMSLAGQKRLEKEHKKKGRYQVHLKKDDEVHETIEYNIEFPNRVAVRMEYLMSSTKVRLNDREFMDTLYDKLIEEEAKALVNNTKLRQAAERNRVKKLVIDGHMSPPDDMLHLYNHPVFRVNAMLRRLDQHDKGLYVGPKIESDITPVEPYEFDGDQFFKHLHQTGTYWVPSEERNDEQEKLAGKIARAKLRLMEKRRKDAENEKMMRVLYAAENPESVPSKYFDDMDIGVYEEDMERADDTPQVKEEKRQRRIARLKDKLNEEADQRATQFKKKQAILEMKERRRKDRALARQKERDRVFLEERETERARFINEHNLRMANKTLTNVRVSVSDADEEHSRQPPTNYKKIFEQPPTPPGLNEAESFRRMRAAYGIKGGNMLQHKFCPLSNPTVARYMDVIKKSDELFHFGSELTDMYAREQATADDFMIKLDRLVK